jgi:hypothetical protein
MFGTSFYNETTRRYTAVFGTLFNDIQITRKDNSGSTIQTMTVPLNYGPMQKFLARLEQDPTLTAPQITLPRMSFELTGMSYDAERNLTPMGRHSKSISNNDSSFNTQYTPAPYNLTFQLNIMTKFKEDGTKIIEQILPYFKPDFTPTVKLIDALEVYLDVPIVLDSVTFEDSYEGNFEQRRALIWTLTFTMKGYFFGPVTQKKVIKFVKANMYSDVTSNTINEYVTVQPGLTSNNTPTQNINETVPYANINFDDDWAYVTHIEDYPA